MCQGLSCVHTPWHSSRFRAGVRLNSAGRLDRPALGSAVVRTVSTSFAPDGDRLREFAKCISASKKLALIYGHEIDRSGGWDAGVAFAEKLNVPVFHSPNTERPSFHRLGPPLCLRSPGLWNCPNWNFPKIKSDFLGGVRSGVNGTPSFFVNGASARGILLVRGPCRGNRAASSHQSIAVTRPERQRSRTMMETVHAPFAICGGQRRGALDHRPGRQGPYWLLCYQNAGYVCGH
jgi:hypothetical protein